MKTLRFAAAAIILSVLIISGCSNSESQSASTQLPGAGAQSPQANESGEQKPAGQAQSEEGQMIEPKQLISKEEAAFLIGEAVKDGAFGEQQMLGMKICFYTAENSASKGYLQIAVIQQGSLKQESSGSPEGSGQSGNASGSGGAGGKASAGQSGSGSAGQSGGSGGSELTPKGIFEALKKSAEDLNAAETGRIGDDNFISAQGMAVLSGDYFIYVTAGNNDPAKVGEIVRKAGELAVTNLKRIQGQ